MCGKLGYHATQCRNGVGKNDNPAIAIVNLTEADNIIVEVIFQVNIVDNGSGWKIAWCY